MKQLILALLLSLCVLSVNAQDLKRYIETAWKQLNTGDYENAEKNYDVYKRMTGQTDKEFESLLKSKKTSGKGIVGATAQSYVENAGCGLNMKMVYVEGGSFRMGATSEQGSDADSDESPVHTVHLESYYMAECEVTQAQWKKIMGTSIYQQRDKADTQWVIRGIGDNNPMCCVTWEEAQDFCRRLSSITGKTYLLPTEAQWEYAARGGNKSRNYKYSGSYAVEAVAWYGSNSNSSTHQVKQRKANELGLYDMSGNVWEWCGDWYDSYTYGNQYNPTGASSGSYRVMRGGCWSNESNYCRVSDRNYDEISCRGTGIGFRIVCLL